MPVFLSNVNSQKKITKWYDTTDPYEITFGIVGLCGYNKTTKQKYCDFRYQACYAQGFYFYTETLNIQKTILGITGEQVTEKGML